MSESKRKHIVNVDQPFRRCLSSVAIASVLLVAVPVAADMDCFTLKNSSFNGNFCAGGNGSCTECYETIIVYNGTTSGPETRPAPHQVAALTSQAVAFGHHSELAGEEVKTLSLVARSCEEESLFDAIDQRRAPTPVRPASKSPVTRSRSSDIAPAP